MGIIYDRCNLLAMIDRVKNKKSISEIVDRYGFFNVRKELLLMDELRKLPSFKEDRTSKRRKARLSELTSYFSKEEYPELWV